LRFLTRSPKGSAANLACVALARVGSLMQEASSKRANTQKLCAYDEHLTMSSPWPTMSFAFMQNQLRLARPGKPIGGRVTDNATVTLA